MLTIDTRNMCQVWARYLVICRLYLLFMFYILSRGIILLHLNYDLYTTHLTIPLVEFKVLKTKSDNLLRKKRNNKRINH